MVPRKKNLQSNLNKVLKSVEEKLQILDTNKNILDEQIEQKRAEIRDIEQALEHLELLENQLSSANE